MKIKMLIFLYIFCFFSKNAIGQKILLLDNNVSTQNERYYNLKESDMYIGTEYGEKFIPKIDSLEFHTDKALDSLVNLTNGGIVVIIRNHYYEYRIAIGRKYYLTCKTIMISIFSRNKKKFYSVTFLPDKGENYGFISDRLEINRNRSCGKKK